MVIHDWSFYSLVYNNFKSGVRPEVAVCVNATVALVETRRADTNVLRHPTTTVRTTALRHTSPRPRGRTGTNNYDIVATVTEVEQMICPPNNYLVMVVEVVVATHLLSLYLH